MGYAERGERGPVWGEQLGDVGGAEEEGGLDGAGGSGEGEEGCVAEVGDVGDVVEGWGGEGFGG